MGTFEQREEQDRTGLTPEKKRLYKQFLKELTLAIYDSIPKRYRKGIKPQDIENALENRVGPLFSLDETIPGKILKILQELPGGEVGFYFGGIPVNEKILKRKLHKLANEYVKWKGGKGKIVVEVGNRKDRNGIKITIEKRPPEEENIEFSKEEAQVQ